MPATPARIAKSTVDGVVVERTNPGLKQLHANAIDVGEIETFFDNPADAQALLDERFTWMSDPARFREAVEFDGSIDLGTGISLTPASPLFRVVDETRGLDDYGAVRAYAANYESDRYAIELIGLGDAIPPIDPLSIGGVPDDKVAIGDVYLFTPHAAGGETPYEFALAAPNGVPKGLVFDPQTGELSGTIGTGTYDALAIGGTPDTTAPPGQPYSWKPTVTGGVPKLTFSLAEALPPGLVFNPATGEVSGTPD